jgi:hypothetical protein
MIGMAEMIDHGYDCDNDSEEEDGSKQAGSANLMKTTTLMGALLLGCLAGPLQAQAPGEETMKADTDTGKALCAALDLTRPGLAAVRGRAEAEDYAGALAAYRDHVVDLAARLDLGEPPGFWLWGATKAEDLLKDGSVGTAQYGEFNKVTRYTLGLPGRVEWNKVPEDGYDVVLRDVSTLHWVGTLAAAYRKNHDPAYLRAFLGYWDDYARNWLPAHQQLMSAGTRIQWDHQPHVQESIVWGSKSKLYFAWRLDNLFSWLPAAIAVSPEQAKAALDPRQLATVVLEVARFEVPGAIRGLESVGTPNQFVHCALGLLKTSLVLQDLRDGPAWTETAIRRMEWYIASCGYLADGSDMEQSFNYNPGLIGALDAVMALARANPPLKGQDFPWLARFQAARDGRERFLDAVVMPDGRRPATGCDNTWGHSRERAVAAYAKAKGTLPPLRERIHNHLLGDGTLPDPAFTSIYFPYGGWVALRDGWTGKSLYAFMKTSRPAPGHMREGGNGLALAAYGRYLLVNSGADAYSDRGVYSRYFDSTVSQTSLSVDGYSQLLNAGTGKPRYDQPIAARWHSSAFVDVAEGIYDSPYGGWNFRTGARAKAVVTDVRHERQILFLRRLGVWIITDRLICPGSHDYAQSWCLSPEFAEAEVVIAPDGRSASTHSASGANLDLHAFSPAPLACSKHYGEKSDTAALGWRALNWNEAQQRYTPAVDLLTEWRGSGNQVVVTLIVPAATPTSLLASSRDASVGETAGFSADLAEGIRIGYLAGPGGALRIADVEAQGEALLVVTDAAGQARGLVLEAGRGGYEFARSADGALAREAAIRAPAVFRWAGADGEIRPEYE